MFDRLYINNALKTARGKLILKALFAIGNGLNINVVADGIAKEEDIIFLLACGCMAASGSFYSEKLPKKQYKDYVKGKLIYGLQKTEFRFNNGFLSADGKYKCSVNWKYYY